MLNEVLEYLNLKPGAKIVDATMNGGGHTIGILEKEHGARVLGIEWDPDIVENLKFKIKNEKLESLETNLTIVNDSYVNLKQIIEKNDFQPDGIVFDLGVSSVHYEKSGRGFSFQKNEMLDMRFNPETETITAADIVNKESRERLEEIFRVYGEEQFAETIALNITKDRAIKPIIMTDELVAIVNASVPGWYKHKKIHPATKIFQALRIAVNNELDNVEKGVLRAIEVLSSGGRLIVISFHGIEDKIVREIFKQKAKEQIIRWVVKGTVKPRWDEVRQNPRARSAKMKVVEKVI